MPNLLTIISIASGLAAASLVAASAFSPRKEVVTEVRIAATPEAVWAVLADGACYPDWNPFIVSMNGDLVTGERLQTRMQTQPGQTMDFSPRILVADEGRELRWLGHVGLPGIFDGEHYFVLTQEDGQTRLVHGERFSGLLVWFYDVEQFRPNLEAMNAALEKRVESSLL